MSCSRIWICQPSCRIKAVGTCATRGRMVRWESRIGLADKRRRMPPLDSRVPSIVPDGPSNQARMAPLTTSVRDTIAGNQRLHAPRSPAFGEFGNQSLQEWIGVRMFGVIILG